MANILRALLVVLASAFGLNACDRNKDVTPAPPVVGVEAKHAALHIAATPGQIAPQVVTEFSKRGNIPAELHLFDSAAQLEARVLAGESGLDVVVLQGAFIEKQTNAGVFLALQKDQLPGLRRLDARLLQYAAEYDPENRQSVPYRAWSVRLGYSEPRIRALLPEAPVDSWSILLNPEFAAALQSCGVGMLDSPTVVFKTMLVSMGRDPRKPSRQDLDAVSAKLLALRPFIRTIGSSAEIAQGLGRGELCVAMTLGSEIHARTDTTQTLNYVVPREGTVLAFDMLTIPADAKHPRNAHALVDFLVDRSGADADSSLMNLTNALAEGTDAAPLFPATSFSADVEREVIAAWRAFVARPAGAER